MFELFAIAQPVVCTNCPGVVTVAPTVVSVPFLAQSPVKTTVQYRRGLLGRLQPVGATTVYEPVTVEAKGKGKPAKAAAKACKECGK